jgi:hydrogenase maturation protease
VKLVLTELMEEKYATLILGLGNDILTDDGIGPKLVQKLEKDLIQANVVLKTAAVGGLEIIEQIKDYRKVIIIDGIKTTNGVPGTVYHMNTGNYKETLHLSNFHDLTFLTALELAEQMEISLPEQIEILAIEIIEDLVFSNKFSQAIAKNYNQIYREVLEAVRKLI